VLKVNMSKPQRIGLGASKPVWANQDADSFYKALPADGEGTAEAAAVAAVEAAKDSEPIALRKDSAAPESAVFATSGPATPPPP
jgi:hypothetical protein